MEMPLTKQYIYQLYVKVDSRADWQLICEIEAETHPEAFRKAMLCIQPDHYDKRIRLERKADDDTAIPPVSN